MNLDDVSMIVQFFGGLGMFLYGMKMMSAGMQKFAGDKMQHMMGVLTNRRFMGVLVGGFITMIIQSSGATSVMAIGMVNAGIMNLTQSVGVIMGANVGTTATAWIVSATQLGDTFAVMKPSFFAPILIGIGAILVMFGKSHKKNITGELLIAIGVLFVGLTWMSDAVKPYQDSEIFVKAITMLGANPFLGIMVGFVVTFLMQSSSASIGVLQSLAMNGMITANIAVYICLGACIGSCTTALISSIGSTKNGKRVAVINLLFNCIGVVIFGTIMSIVFMAVPSLPWMTVDAVKIAIFHSSFKIINTVFLFPMGNILVKLACKIVKDKPEGEYEEEDELVLHLDDRFLKSPSFAIEMVTKEIAEMGKLAGTNLRAAMKALIFNDYEKLDDIFLLEKKINRYQKQLTSYMVKINGLELNEHQNTAVKNLLYAINDIERVGDHAENIAEYAQNMKRDGIVFSDMAKDELVIMNGKVMQNYDWAIEAIQTGNKLLHEKITAYEEQVDAMELELRDRHILRLSRNECRMESGVIFLDIISNLERVSDHAMNLVEYVQENE
ncbi:MAG: Na/Pi cotransporter family protein [Clostridiales bacterium]|nr:Na/Pi cotransporter family protein [Clostridiales bacterium]